MQLSVVLNDDLRFESGSKAYLFFKSTSEQRSVSSFEADSRLLKMASKLGVSPKIMADI